MAWRIPSISNRSLQCQTRTAYASVKCKMENVKFSGLTVLAGTVNVKVSAPAEGFPRAASFALTSGMDFTGADVKLVDAPRWADSVYVRNGDIVLRVRKGTAVFVR